MPLMPWKSSPTVMLANSLSIYWMNYIKLVSIAYKVYIKVSSGSELTMGVVGIVLSDKSGSFSERFWAPYSSWPDALANSSLHHTSLWTFHLLIHENYSRHHCRVYLAPGRHKLEMACVVVY